ncbi:MAG: hypothetical protein OXG60_09120 [Chloroflexi bacterium]|nr:hypothetical protein [Chloroflexota bacterium]
MYQQTQHPLTHITVWAALSIGLPLLPILVGVLIALLQRAEISFLNLLDGIELFLIALWLVTATNVDLAKFRFSWAKPFQFTLIGLGVLNLIFLTLVYVINRVRSLDFDPTTTLTLATGIFVAVCIISLALQLFMSFTNHRRGNST